MALEGLWGLNPANGKEIPIWISDYVLMTYGTGAIMSVPAHDERDWEFAKKFDLPIVPVIDGGNVEEAAYVDIHAGHMINSDFLDGMEVEDAIQKMIEWITEKAWAIAKPIINCATGSSRDNVTGANRSPSFTATTADGCRSPKKSCLWNCPKWKITSPRTTVNRP